MSWCHDGWLVKLGNYANVFGALLEDEVFVGPLACLLEDPNPRATTPDGARKGPGDFVARPVTVRLGASIGASAVILPGVTIGRFAMVAAGAVVHRHVPDYALMVGNPARQVGYACRCGQRLDEDLACACGRRYRLDAGGARCCLARTLSRMPARLGSAPAASVALAARCCGVRGERTIAGAAPTARVADQHLSGRARRHGTLYSRPGPGAAATGAHADRLQSPASARSRRRSARRRCRWWTR